MCLIVDISALPSGHFCARLAALAGDEVYRYGADSPGCDAGTLSRSQLRDAFLSEGMSRSIVDWDNPRDREVVEETMRRADAIVSSYSAGRFDSPYDLATVSAIADHAVHVVLSPYGIEGAYRNFLSSSLTDWAAGGYMYITGERERAPVPGPPDLCAYTAGYVGAISMEAALARVRAGGCPETIDVSHMEAMLSVHQLSFTRQAAGEAVARTGNDIGPATYPHRAYPGQNGELFIGIVTDDEWDRFLIAIDRLDLCDDPRLETGAARKRNRNFTDRVVTDWLIGWDVSAAAEHLQDNRVPATRCATPETILTDPQLLYRGFLRDSPLGGGRGSVLVPGNVLPARATHAGRIGAHAAGKPGVPLNANGPLPLSGITVIDLSLWWAGPLASRILADLGADVIRIDRPALPRDDASWPLAQRLVHEQVNRNKRSVVIDLGRPEGVALACRLMEQADVFVQNFRPGVVERMGLGWETAQESNPGLVYVSLSGYGGEGPKSRWGTYGTLSEAASSVRFLTGYPGEGGMRLGDQLPDAICGLAGALAALRGLRNRSTTGLGCHFDISQLETYVAMIGEELAAASARLLGLEVDTGDCAHVLNGTLPCSDRDEWIAVSADQSAAAKLAALLPGVTHSSVDANLFDLLLMFSATCDAGSLADMLRSNGAAAFPVASPKQLVDDPHLAERGFFIDAVVRGRHFDLPGSPIRSLGTAMVEQGGPAPLDGQHTRDVLRDELHISDKEVEQLLNAGIVRQWSKTPEPRA